ncbi:MAG: outer membrane beta-barrel protein, partial [Planctomycetota bacterium]
AGDAAGALRLVAGASTADGRSAVIRGLPDRYVSSQMNGVLLPTADEDKRAVELDQFPTEVIDSLQVSKTFTPDQQGNASGGAVNLILKGVPDQPFFLRWKVGASNHERYSGRDDFLTYRGGGVHAFGKSGGERGVQEVGEDWNGAVGVTRRDAPIDVDFNGAIGGKVDLGRGWRLGGFVNGFYERDSSFRDDGRDDSLWALRVGEPLTPQFSQGAPQTGEFYTSLLDVQQSRQSATWGGLATAGIASDDHALTFAWLRTETAEDTVTLAEDTRGKQYFFPGHDPEVETSPGFEQILGAPYLRLQTLTYSERKTETLQVNGRHRVAIHGGASQQPVEIDWTVARSSAERDEPDKRQLASAWNPNGVFLQYKPAAQFTLGNLQRTFERITEDSSEEVLSLKLPFRGFGDRPGYLKFGGFRDRVRRQFDQDTFSNFNDPTFFQPGQFDEIDWSQLWEQQEHPITASETDVDYAGRQQIRAGFAMVDFPLCEWAALIGGVRVEATDIEIVNSPEAQALWVPPGQFGTATLLPGDGDVDFSQQDNLPAVALVLEPLSGITLRAAYSETVARQTFKELTPIFQQDYLGGPVFVGNPGLTTSELKNYDLRVDWVPASGSLLSASWFKKDIERPIEYVEKLATYSFTTAVNYPRGKLRGVEVELRQALGSWWHPLDGLSLGGNSTWIDASVRVPDEELDAFEQLQEVRPNSVRDMTNAPDYLWNAFGTFDITLTGTSIGVFYTVTGDTLVQGPGPSNDFFVPATYRTRHDSLNAVLSQSLGGHVKLTLAAKNLTDSSHTEVYRSEFLAGDTVRRSWSTGTELSLSIGGEIRF